MSPTINELLRALADDVRRALPAGACAAAQGHLQHHARTLHSLGRKAPVLERLAGLIDRLDTSGSPAPAFLDLLLATGQLRASQATADVPGTLVAAAQNGPWATPLPVAAVFAVYDGLTRPGKWPAFDKVITAGLPADLRLLDPLLGGVGHRNEDLVKRLTQRVLPAFGAPLGGEVRRRWNPKGKFADFHLLELACRLDPALGAELCLRAFDEGNGPMCGSALQHLPTVLPPEHSVPLLVAYLTRVGRVSETAVAALGQVGAAAVPALLEALDGSHLRRRVGAATALGAIGPAAREGIPRLLKALEDEAPVRAAAAQALGRLGPEALVSVPRLCEMVKTDPHWAACENAVSALLDLGAAPAVAVPAIHCALVNVMGDRTWPAAVGMHALRTLGPEAAAAVPRLCYFLGSGIDWIRSNAAYALASIGEAASPAVPILVRQMDAAAAWNRDLAAFVLGELGPVARAAIPELQAALGDSAWEVRRTAALALVHIAGPKTPSRPEVIRILREAVQNRHYEKLESVIEALRRLDSSGRTLLKVLLDVLRDPETKEREPVLAHLRRLNPPRETIRAIVLPLVRETPWAVRPTVRWLGADPEVLAAMLEGVRRRAEEDGASSDGGSLWRACSAEALGEFGPAAQEAVPILTEFARRPGYERLAAAVALARVNGNVEAALAVVFPALRADAEEIEWAVRALGGLGPAAAPAVPALLHLLDASEDSVRREVIETLGRIGPSAGAAVPALVGALDEGRGWQGSSAVWALLRIGTEVPAALAALPVNFWDEESRWTSYAEEETARQNLEALADSPGAVRSLSAALTGDESTRLRAALILGLMEKAVPEIIPVLAEAASTDPPDGLLRLRVCAAKRLTALASTAPTARAALPVLKAGLGRVRHWALRCALHRAVSRLENGN